jgi:hypothetical protein
MKEEADEDARGILSFAHSTRVEEESFSDRRLAEDADNIEWDARLKRRGGGLRA